MATSEVTYLGGLRTSATHLGSGTVIETDPPLDNKGKGERFSPTDLLATSYASCMLTIIGIYCEEHGHNYSHGKARVNKIMGTAPRRVTRLEVELDLTGNGWDDETAEKIIRAGKACPVAKSLHPDIEIDLQIRTK